MKGALGRRTRRRSPSASVTRRATRRRPTRGRFDHRDRGPATEGSHRRPARSRRTQPNASAISRSRELPHPRPGGRVVGLRVRLGLGQAGEVAPADAGELRVGHQPPGRVQTLGEAALRRRPGRAHHLGVHQGRRVQRVHRDVGADQVGGQVVAGHHHRQLGVPVGVDPGVVLLAQRVVRVEGELAGGGDLHDPRGGAGLQQQPQPVAQVVGREVVDREPQLDPVDARLTNRPGGAEPDPGVVHQHVQGVVLGEHGVRQPVHLTERGEVGLHGVDGDPVLPLDLGDQVRQPIGTAAVGHHLGPVRGQAVDQGPAQPGRGSGDEDGLLVQGMHVGSNHCAPAPCSVAVTADPPAGPSRRAPRRPARRR